MTPDSTLAIFGAISFFSALPVALGWRYGYVPTWAARTFNRFWTLVWLTLVIAAAVEGDAHWATVRLIVFALSLINWNHPKDDNEPPRKRRKKPVEKKEASPNWTGLPSEAT